MRFSVLLLVVFLLALPIGTEAQDRRFFGNIIAPCAGPAGAEVCKQMKDDLKAIRGCEVDKPCPKATEILKQLYGVDSYRPSLPDFIVYFDQDAKGEYRGRPTGVLLWQGMNTPHIYGARDIYVLAFSERKACIEASVAVDFKSEPNPLGSVLGSTAKAEDPKTPATDRKAANLIWYPLSGDTSQGKEHLWLGVTRLAIEVNSVDRLNVQFAQVKVKDGSPECATDPKYKSDYLAANAFFSNSPDSRVAVSIALGMTTNPKGTAVATGDSANQYFNGYAFAKYYLRRPQLRAAPEFEQFDQARAVSYALVLGTNITKSAFNELVVGVSAGHLRGNMGIIVGLNSLAGATGSDSGRKWRPFAGLEYSF